MREEGTLRGKTVRVDDNRNRKHYNGEGEGRGRDRGKDKKREKEDLRRKTLSKCDSRPKRNKHRKI